MANFKAYPNHTNQFISKKSRFKEKERTESWEDKIIDWCTFYRRNMHRFIQHYFGIKLHFYQIIWVYFMSISENFVAIASRSSAKSWLIAVYALAKGVLYPNSEIVIAAATLKQAGVIIKKIEGLKLDHPNVAREIKEFIKSDDKFVLHNGSTIQVAAPRDSSRGLRSTLTIGEEFRIMDKNSFDMIIRPFAYVRQAPYLKDPSGKYNHLAEEPQEILISSAYYKSHWWYPETIKIIKDWVNGKKSGFIAFDYLTGIHHGIKTQKIIDRERALFDDITFQLEYENIPFGESSDAFFRLAFFNDNQKLKRAFYPQRDDVFDVKKKSSYIDKVAGEIRVVSSDIAVANGGKTNDNTAIICARLLPSRMGYQREIVYMETHNGGNTFEQAKRMKEIFYDFDADYFILDIKTVGHGIYDMLGMVTKNDERGIEYPAWTIMEHESLKESDIEEFTERTYASNAEPLIYIVRGSSEFNHTIAHALRDKLRNKQINFLIPDMEAEEYLLKHNNDFMKISDVYSEKAWYLYPYVQTNALINECVSLEKSLNGAYLTLKEPNGARKDRYSSLAYLNYFATLLDKNIMKEESKEADLDILLQYIVY